MAQQFPKWKYPPAGSTEAAIIVADAAAEALLEGWLDLPADYVPVDADTLAAAQKVDKPLSRKSDEYPKWKYPPLGVVAASPVVVDSRGEEDELIGWFDAPATLYQPGPSAAEFVAQPLPDSKLPNSDQSEIVGETGEGKPIIAEGAGATDASEASAPEGEGVAAAPPVGGDPDAPAVVVRESEDHGATFDAPQSEPAPATVSDEPAKSGES